MKKLAFIIRTRLKTLFDAVVNEKIKTSFLEAIPFWLAALLTGLIAVAYTRIFNYAEGLLHRAMTWDHWFIFLFAPLCFLLSWLVVTFFSPNARGSGIPQVMAAIDLSATKYQKSLSRLLSVRIIIAKVISSALMVLGGGAVGREGPTIQISGSVFRLVNKFIPSSWPRISQKSFILTGAAAGLSAAFNTPLGGIVFAIEELAKIHISYFRTALFTSVIIAGLAAQGFLGPYLYLGYPDVQKLDPTIYFAVALVAVVAGLGGSGMSRIILKIMRWKRNFNTAKSILFIVVAGLIVAAFATFFNSDILGSGKDLMVTVLFSPAKHLGWQSMFARIFGPIVAFTVGGAGGIFAPSLAAGASIGSFFSGLFGFFGANANILILSGMVGFLTGVTRTPFTSAILVLEMTDRHSVIFHLMLAALVSNLASLIIEKHSLYEQLKEVYIDDVRENSTGIEATE
jgi:H+/Cl- antiporter ClcA